MAKFDYDSGGYNTSQVDSYLSKICLSYENKLAEQKDKMIAVKSQNKVLQDNIINYKKKEEQLTKALMLVLDKAEQYESSKRKIYDLEIKRVRLIYNKFLNIYKHICSEYVDVGQNAEINDEIYALQNSIDNVLQTKKQVENNDLKEDLKNYNMSYLKNVLNKMEYTNYKSVPKDNDLDLLSKDVNKVSTTNSDNEIVKEHKKENNRLALISEKLNNVIKNNYIDKHSKQPSIVEDFLSSGEPDDNFKSSIYAKKIVHKRKTAEDVNPFNFDFPEPNESGFDLKEALNPKDDLDTIMQVFDFSKKK